MKKIIYSLLIASCLLLVGCKMSVIEYNDAVVEKLDANSEKIQETITAYNESIPDIVTEKSEIDASTMRDALKAAQKSVESSEAILTMESSSETQQTEVTTEFTIYMDSANQYLEKYEEMVVYYEDAGHKEDPNMVNNYDEELFDENKLLDQFLEENNNIAEILKTHL